MAKKVTQEFRVSTTRYLDEDGLKDLWDKIKKYVADNAIEIDGENIDFSKYVTQEQLEEALANIDTEDIDLSAYVTTEALALELNAYAKREHLHEQYATKTYVDDAVANIEIPDIEVPDVDLSNYYTKEETDALIPEVPSLDGYATHEYVDTVIENLDITADTDVYYGTEEPEEPYSVWINPDGEADIYATKEYVDDAISNIEIGDVDVDLTNYYTKTEVDALIPTVPDISGKADKVHTHVMSDITDYVAPTVDLSGYAKTSDIPDVSAYQTEEQVIALIQEYATGGVALPPSEEGEF